MTAGVSVLQVRTHRRRRRVVCAAPGATAAAGAVATPAQLAGVWGAAVHQRLLPPAIAGHGHGLPWQGLRPKVSSR